MTVLVRCWCVNHSRYNPLLSRVSSLPDLIISVSSYRTLFLEKYGKPSRFEKVWHLILPMFVFSWFEKLWKLTLPIFFFLSVWKTMETHFMRLYQRKHKQHKNRGVMKYHQFFYLFSKKIEILLHSKVNKSLQTTNFVTSKQNSVSRDHHSLFINKNGVRKLKASENSILHDR